MKHPTANSTIDVAGNSVEREQDPLSMQPGDVSQPNPQQNNQHLITESTADPAERQHHLQNNSQQNSPQQQPPQQYKHDNIFARIIRGELPSDKIYENQHALAFHDLYPDALVHALVVPKGPYINWADFYSAASQEEIQGLTDAVLQTVARLGLSQGGYRIATNTGAYGMQAIFHFHYHILSGEPLGGMVNRQGE